MVDSATLTRLTLKQLRYFREIAKLGNISEAAERLGLSQPPLTMAMKSLGETLGVTLFERHGRGIRLTPASEELLKGTEHVFTLLERVCQRVRTADESGIARLTIGITDDYICSPLISELMTVKHRGVAVAINTVISTGSMLPGQVLDGMIDIALTVASVDGYPKDIVAKRLPPARIMALVPTGHDLSMKSSITPAELAKERMILMPEEPPLPFSRACAKIFDAAGVQPQTAYEVINAPVTQSLVEAGLGIGLVSEFSARDSARSVRVPLESRHARLGLAVVHDRRPKSEFVPLLAELITRKSRGV